MKKTLTVISISWLIKLRWFAVGFVIFVTFFSKNVLNITSIQSNSIYLLDVVLLLLNVFFYLCIKRITSAESALYNKAPNFLLNMQIATDYIILTLLIHFSGGMDNPFIIVYLFHVIVAGIMLPFLHSFLQTTFALLLLGAIVFLESNSIIPHYCLKDFIPTNHLLDSKYMVWTSLVFVLAAYLILYMTNSVTGNLRKFERAYRIANAELNRKDKIKNEFVLKLTHDTKGHIYAIQSCLSVLRSNIIGKLEPKQEEFVNRAYNRSIILSNFAKDILNHTQMLMKKELKKESFSLKDIAQKVVNTYANNAKWKLINVNFEIDSDIENIYGNKLSIESMLSNLFLNAIKYTPEKGSVSLIIRNKKKNVQIEVSDTGIGIADEHKLKVFDDFYRAPNAKTSNKEGTGMGLTIVNQIVKIHKGKIWLISKINKGSTFWVILPKNP